MLRGTLEEREALVIQMAQAGVKGKDIAKALGYKCGTSVTNILRKHGIKVDGYKDLKARVIECREQGMSIKETAECLGIPIGRATYWCKTTGYGGQRSDNKQDYTVEPHACPVCGKITTRKMYCSDECSHEHHWRLKNHRRRIKLKEALVDKDIELPQLYRRDGCMCHICGGACDFEDFKINENGYFVVGKTYPSIDHVIPLAKGGKHEWSNVKLAHHYCNTLKSDESYSPIAWSW